MTENRSSQRLAEPPWRREWPTGTILALVADDTGPYVRLRAFEINPIGQTVRCEWLVSAGTLKASHVAEISAVMGASAVHQLINRLGVQGELFDALGGP